MTEKKKARHPSRCNKCQGRKTFNMNPLDYDEPPMCPCGGYYRFDRYRKEVETKNRCSCSGYHWSISNGRHKIGSPRCYYNNDGSPKTEPPD